MICTGCSLEILTIKNSLLRSMRKLFSSENHYFFKVNYLLCLNLLNNQTAKEYEGEVLHCKKLILKRTVEAFDSISAHPQNLRWGNPPYLEKIFNIFGIFDKYFVYIKYI